jgi:hypothetical protein
LSIQDDLDFFSRVALAYRGDDVASFKLRVAVGDE